MHDTLSIYDGILHDKPAKFIHTNKCNIKAKYEG